MSHALEGCAVCHGHAGRMSKVVVEGRALELCRTHATVVAAAMPETFEDLRALFVGDDRRSQIDRRSGQDRREFPRPEGRRHNGGRRAEDSQES